MHLAILWVFVHLIKRVSNMRSATTGAAICRRTVFVHDPPPSILGGYIKKGKTNLNKTYHKVRKTGGRTVKANLMVAWRLNSEIVSSIVCPACE